MTWPTTAKFPEGTAPTLTTTPLRRDVFFFTAFVGITWTGDLFYPKRGDLVMGRAARAIRAAASHKRRKVTPTGLEVPTGNVGDFTITRSQNFATAVPEGQVAANYSDLDFYPIEYTTTYGNLSRGAGTGDHYAGDANVSVVSGIAGAHGNAMQLRCYREAPGVYGGHFVGAAPEVLKPDGTASQLYGRYAVRFKAEQVAGVKTAWLLWPESEAWPRDGEIDFPEGDLDSTMSAFMHRQEGVDGSDQDYYGTAATYADWHIAEIEWAPDSCKFFLDGTLIGHSTSRVPNTPMRWVLQTENSLDAEDQPGDVTAHVWIDWFAMWSYTP